MDSAAAVLYSVLTTMSADIAFLHCGSFPRCTARLDKKFDGYYTLQFCSAGSVEVSYDGRRTVLAGKHFWTCYPGPRIAFGPAEGHRDWAHRYVAFTGPRVDRWISESLFPRGPIRASSAGKYEERFDAMLAAVGKGDPLGRARAAHLLEGILIDLADERATRAQSEEKSFKPWLADAMSALAEAAVSTAGNESNDSADDAIDYASLAANAAMGLSTFRRRFKNATGLSPRTYVLQVRTARARELLGESDRPIKAIAESLGYRDVFFFSRQFKRMAGVSPGEYRRSRQR